MPGVTQSSNEQSLKGEKELFDSEQKAFRDLLLKIGALEKHLKHAIPSLLHQVTSEKVRKILENNQNAELHICVTDAKEITKSLDELISIKQILQNAQKKNNRNELQNLKNKIENKLGDSGFLKLDIEYMEGNIKLLSEVNKELHRIEKTVIKSHEVMAKVKHDFDKIKQNIQARTTQSEKTKINKR